MEPRDPDSYEKQIIEMAASSLKDHRILEVHHGPGVAEGWWLVGRPGCSAYKAQICVLKWGTLLVHGDVTAVLFGHYSDKRITKEKVVHWMAKANSGYYSEKAAIAMGSRQVRREADVYLWEVEDQISELMKECEGDIKKLSEHEQRMLVMWTEAAAMVKDGDELCRVDEYVYGTTGDFEMIPSGAVIDSSVVWAHCLVKRLWELIGEQEEEGS